MVSVIIPTKNEAKRLRLLLSSLMSQSEKDFEVIINDDSKTEDDTPAVIKKFSSQMRLRHIYNNHGMAQSRKAGAKVAKGQYLLHLDADMTLSPHVLESCISQANQGNGGVVIPEISSGDGFWSKVRAFEKSMYVGDETIESARFYTKKAYWTVNGHNEHMVLSEDKDLDLRVRAAGFTIGRINDPIYHNEDYNLRRSVTKKFFYGKTAAVFIAAHPRHTFTQGNLLFRPAFFRHWRDLLAHPILAASMFLMKFLEGLMGLLGLFFGRYLGTIDPWKKK